MADQAQIDAADRKARLALLEQIQKSAEGTTSAGVLERLAYAYAMTAGAAYGKLPGGPTNISVSK